MRPTAKHDGEEEGEGDDQVRGRVDLAVAGDAVRVDDVLEAAGELVRAVERRRQRRVRVVAAAVLLLRAIARRVVHAVQNRGHRASAVLLRAYQSIGKHT